MRCARIVAVLGVSGGLALVAAAPPAQAASANVAALQVALKALGLYPVAIDGISGRLTRRGVRRLQHHKRLVVDGIAGPRTRHTLGRRGRPRLGSRAMRIGQRGWDVAALQFLLNVRGYGPGGFDGGFGPSTRRAVARFQRAAALTVDGVAGPSTLRALRHRRSSGVPSGPVRFLRPIAGAIGDGFGWVGGRRHTGVDIPADEGTPVGAAGRGVVVFAGWNDGGYGNLVVVKHRLGFESWYAHLSRIAADEGERSSAAPASATWARRDTQLAHTSTSRCATSVRPLTRCHACFRPWPLSHAPAPRQVARSPAAPTPTRGARGTATRPSPGSGAAPSVPSIASSEENSACGALVTARRPWRTSASRWRA